MRRTIVLSAVAAAGIAAAFAGPAGAAPHAAAPRAASHAKASHLRYVALGDSYSAASGNTPPDSTAPPQCLRSTVNYPHVIASKIHATLTDVTCGAAKTSDYFSSQYQGVKPQLAALSKKTQLVTMTIGGNDSNVFIDSIAECGSAAVTTAGTGSPCKDMYGNSFVKTIETTTYPAIVKALKAVHRKAPHARVAILTYPWILPKTKGCFPTMPVATGDVPYLRHEQAVLNSVIGRAAKKTHSTLVNLNGVSNGHDACQASGVRWIEPVVGGTNPVIVHPNPLGEQKMAAQTIKVLHLHR